MDLFGMRAVTRPWKVLLPGRCQIFLEVLTLLYSYNFVVGIPLPKSPQLQPPSGNIRPEEVAFNLVSVVHGEISIPKPKLDGC